MNDKEKSVCAEQERHELKLTQEKPSTLANNQNEQYPNID